MKIVNSRIIIFNGMVIDENFTKDYIEKDLARQLGEFLIKEIKIKKEKNEYHKEFTASINVVTDEEYKILQYIKENNIKF